MNRVKLWALDTAQVGLVLVAIPLSLIYRPARWLAWMIIDARDWCEARAGDIRWEARCR